MYPKHSNPTRYKGRAPYNFVPLPDKVAAVNVESIPEQNVYTNNTGYIDCLLTTESPLYTRCAMTPVFFKEDGDTPFYKLDPDAKKNERGQFFHLKDKDCPLIPGSSLRGMVRALVEIAGYGKMQWVTDKNLIYRGVGDQSSIGNDYRSKLLGPRKRNKLWFEYPLLAVRGGYLRKKGSKWYIAPAREINGETFVHVEYSAANCGFHDPEYDYTKADLIDIYLRPPAKRTEPPRSNYRLTLHLAVVEKLSDVSKKPKPGFEKAVLVRSGDMNNKHMHCAIYEPANKKLIDIQDKMWELYVEDREEPRGFKTRPLEEDGDPLFYLVDDQDRLVFFGPTMMFRLPYEKTVDHYVPDKLREPDKIDMAEAIFGYIDEEEKKPAHAGRVFFTDAKLDFAHDGIWLTQEPFTPKILASPKPTTVQDYLVQDRTRGHDPDDRRTLAHYNTPSPDETVIRGCKMYWHKGNIGLNDIKEHDEANIKNSPKVYTRIRPVKTGVTFSFRMYFENLKDNELGALLWALTLPGEKSGKYRHTLGMGKPFGMGAVRIETELYTSNRDERYNQLFKDDGWDEALNGVSDLQHFIDEFEKFVLKAIDSDKAKLSEVERIKMLLKMLEWPGPNDKLTKYLEPAEYTNRNVLPDSLNVERH